VLLECVLQTAIYSRPYFDKFIISAGSEQESIAGKAYSSYACIVGLDESDFFGFGVKIYFPKLERLVTACGN
jgi:hypothetical protein